jgi:raffinose/stachyose/melibiose transport system permease protein
MTSVKKKPILFILTLVLALLFLSPLFIALMNSLKPLAEIVTAPLSFPVEWAFSNYARAWEIIKLPSVMLNTTLITLLSVSGIVILASMVAYWSERHPSWYSRLLTKALVLSILIPFASIMIPLVKVLHGVRLSNTLAGVILSYWGIGLAFAYFVIRGAVLSLPRELEESAKLDGYGAVGIFALIVLPLLAPTALSVFIMDVFWVWNDFMVPLVALNNADLSTIQLAINRLFGMYNSRWDVALPALVMSLVPIVAVFLALQKNIMSGILMGAVKG